MVGESPSGQPSQLGSELAFLRGRRPGQVRAVRPRADSLYGQRPAHPAASFWTVPSNPAGPAEFLASAATAGRPGGWTTRAGRPAQRLAQEAPTGARPRDPHGAVPGAGEPVSLTGEVRSV